MKPIRIRVYHDLQLECPKHLLVGVWYSPVINNVCCDYFRSFDVAVMQYNRYSETKKLNNDQYEKTGTSDKPRHIHSNPH